MSEPSKYAGKVEEEAPQMQTEGLSEEEVGVIPEAEEMADDELVADPSEVEEEVVDEL